ncbi:hypothetical protein, partial [Acinetobacter baumannii]|uniref:hypothetical protein n=1 Tax=Acinetobacter baumannii TaxID=470 RepID=UPI001D177023
PFGSWMEAHGGPGGGRIMIKMNANALLSGVRSNGVFQREQPWLVFSPHALATHQAFLDVAY